MTYVPTPSGNLINDNTVWNITGSLIKKISLTESDIFCTSRTLLIPVRYRTAHDAMAICEELGETGNIFNNLILSHAPRVSTSLPHLSRFTVNPFQCQVNRKAEIMKDKLGLSCAKLKRSYS